MEGPDSQPLLPPPPPPPPQALCWCDRPLSEGDVQLLLAVRGLEVMQDTPVRVLHRRASKVAGLLCAEGPVCPMRVRMPECTTCGCARARNMRPIPSNVNL